MQNQLVINILTQKIKSADIPTPMSYFSTHIQIKNLFTSSPFEEMTYKDLAGVRSSTFDFYCSNELLCSLGSFSSSPPSQYYPPFLFFPSNLLFVSKFFSCLLVARYVNFGIYIFAGCGNSEDGGYGRLGGV